MDSILTSIKKLLGLTEADTSFDIDIIIHINTAFSIMRQFGVNVDSFSIENKDATWDEYFPDISDVEMIKTYVYLKVRMVFDPPTGGVKDVFEKNIDELEWRICHEVDKEEE